jgi:hypothetical protein
MADDLDLMWVRLNAKVDQQIAALKEKRREGTVTANDIYRDLARAAPKEITANEVFVLAAALYDRLSRP